MSESTPANVPKQNEPIEAPAASSTIYPATMALELQHLQSTNNLPDETNTQWKSSVGTMLELGTRVANAADIAFEDGRNHEDSKPQSTLQNKTSDDSSSSYDSDDSVCTAEDEEETLVAKELVKAAFQQLATQKRPIRNETLLKPIETKRPRYQSMIGMSSIPLNQASSHLSLPVLTKPMQMSSETFISRSDSTPLLFTFGPVGRAAQNISTTNSTVQAVDNGNRNGTGESGHKLKDEESYNPQNVLRSLLGSETYDQCKPIPYDTIDNFFEVLPADGIAGYDLQTVQALRSENIDELRSMQNAGKTFQCGNKFGETLLHAASRRRSSAVVKFLLHECNISPKVCCDYGRNPLHDACWTYPTNFDVVTMILDICPDLLYITDRRGFTPFSYVRKELWKEWAAYLRERGTERLLPNELFHPINLR